MEPARIPLLDENAAAKDNPPKNSAINSSVNAAGKTLGTPTFLVSIVITSIIPLIQLIIGAKYRDQCRIQPLIPTYMIVAGVCGLIVVGILIFLSLTYMCLVSDSAGLAILGMCGACLSFIVTTCLAIFMFIWYILGCVWVFGVHKQVQYDDILQPEYCHPVLYKTAFVLLIIITIWVVIYCCTSCIRMCFGRRSE